MDLVIRDARVIDGTGAAAYRADVAIDGGRIAAVVREGGGPRRPDRVDRAGGGGRGLSTAARDA